MLKFYKSLLEHYDFILVHKSHLINFQHIRQNKKGKGGQVIMADGAGVDISSNHKDSLLNRFR